jgi:hypothetical protein
MDWGQLQAGIASGLVAWALWLLKRWLGVKDSEETRRAVTWAVEQAVTYIAQKYRNAPAVSGELKKTEAIALAESLAPKKMAKLDDGQKPVLVDATYARLRPSLPHPSTHSTHGDDIPIDVVVTHAPSLSERPTPFPPLRGPVGPGAKGGPSR